jgi:hypothetical protein
MLRKARATLGQAQAMMGHSQAMLWHARASPVQSQAMLKTRQHWGMVRKPMGKARNT